MKWDQIIPQVRFVTGEEAKNVLLAVSSRLFQLVDVRQPEEYNRHHLPAAISLPLPDLTDDEHHLDRTLPVLLYCENGDRSLVAARWLNSHGFEDVAVLKGGIATWNEETAFGHFELNLNLLHKDADFTSAVNMAYAMEEGLQLFYTHLARETNDELYKELYRELAHYEVKHMQDLAARYSMELDLNTLTKSEKEIDEYTMEGGGYLDITLIKSLAQISDIPMILGLALSLETQALDFYYRLSLHAEVESVKRFFQEMADSERQHLFFVSKKFDTYLSSNYASNQQI